MKDEYLTARWNNILALGLGFIMLVYVAIVVSTTILSDFAAFLGLAIIAAVYWTVVEQHLNMRVACDMKNSGNEVPVSQSFTRRLIYIAYNVFFWIPIVLPFTRIIDYRTGFILLFVVTVIRAAANLYRNNVLSAEQAAYFPLRSPWMVERNWLVHRNG